MLSWDAGTLWFAAGAVVAALVVVTGLGCTRKWGGLPAPEPLAGALRPTVVSETGGHSPGMAERLCSSYLDWLVQGEGQADLWSSFDQLMRELLTEHLGANRVRCYRVCAGADTLQPISGNSAAAAGPSSRGGVLGHVATSGSRVRRRRPVFRPAAGRPGGPHGGALGMGLAGARREFHAGSHRRWQLAPSGAPSLSVRRAVGQLVTLFWRHTACVERLRIVQRTDRGSGVLTRNDFFTLAAHALADSYRANEPVVAAVLAVEGMRRLDDAGRWRDRDLLIERLGCALASRVRSDDLVGRFADDRFIVLLRRLDSGLGRLIAEKMLATGADCAREVAGGCEDLRLRMGLAGSGFAQPPLEQLLVAAFEAVERAPA